MVHPPMAFVSALTAQVHRVVRTLCEAFPRVVAGDHRAVDRTAGLSARKTTETGVMRADIPAVILSDTPNDHPIRPRRAAVVDTAASFERKL